MFTMLPQPSDLPLSTDDYKLQNQNIQALFIGIDKTVIKDNGNGTISILPSGPVDAGGILFLNNEDVVLTPQFGAALLKIKLVYGSDNSLTPTLTDEDVLFDADRYGYYTSNGERVLNTFLFVNGTQITLLDTNKEVAITVGESTVSKTVSTPPVTPPGNDAYSNGTWNLGNPIKTIHSSSSWLNNNALKIPKTGIYRITFGGNIRVTGNDSYVRDNTTLSTGSNPNTLHPFGQNTLVTLTVGSSIITTNISNSINPNTNNVTYTLDTINTVAHFNANDAISITTQSFAYVSLAGTADIINNHFNLNIMIQEF